MFKDVQNIWSLNTRPGIRMLFCNDLTFINIQLLGDSITFSLYQPSLNIVIRNIDVKIGEL